MYKQNKFMHKINYFNLHKTSKMFCVGWYLEHADMLYLLIYTLS